MVNIISVQKAFVIDKSIAAGAGPAYRRASLRECAPTMIGGSGAGRGARGGRRRIILCIFHLSLALLCIAIAGPFRAPARKLTDHKARE
ncbi:hypothetical protein EVAR_74742_1 [Eumeta japonica]|uniref:Uncharacterized protein n=1 Tax=Eumeta variegata TaxID=151549 RepID=A0A4C1SPU8_EUMVA|nr:hypothetical protein EVAR_74742_1 [Eumeta japonica]